MNNIIEEAIAELGWDHTLLESGDYIFRSSLNTVRYSPSEMIAFISQRPNEEWRFSNHHSFINTVILKGWLRNAKRKKKAKVPKP